MEEMDICHLRLFPVLITCSVCAVFLAQENLNGSTHDQRGRDGFFAAGESILYPITSFLPDKVYLYVKANGLRNIFKH